MGDYSNQTRSSRLTTESNWRITNVCFERKNYDRAMVGTSEACHLSAVRCYIGFFDSSRLAR